MGFLIRCGITTYSLFNWFKRRINSTSRFFFHAFMYTSIQKHTHTHLKYNTKIKYYFR